MKTTLLLCFFLGLGLVAPAQRLRSRPATVAQLLHQLPAPAAGLRRGIATTLLRPGQVVSYSYDDATRQWVTPLKTAFLYDGLGRPTQQTESDSATGQPFNRTFTAYNAAGQVTETRDQVYFLGSFEDFSRTVSTYDARQQLIERQVQQPTGAGTWQPESGVRYLNTYDAGSGLTAQTVQVYRPAASAYADSARLLFTLVAAGGAWTTRVTQEPDGSGSWRNVERDCNAVWHDFAQQQLASAIAQDWLGTGWRTAARLLGTYTATTTETVVQDSTNGWTNSQRQYASYDAAGNLLDAQLSDWTGTAWATVLEANYQLAYNPDQTLRRRLTRVDFGSGLQPAQLENFSDYRPIVLASRATPAATALGAYPNPSPDGRFTLLLSAPAATGEVCVFDALGREVARDAWAGTPRSRYALDLSARPAGLYTVRVQTAAGRVAQRVSVR